MNKILQTLFSPALMFMLLVMLGSSLGVATFIENDFGSEYAKLVVYNTWWLELIFLLLAINLTGRIFKKKTYRKKTFAIFIYHLAFILMLVGAAVTRYFGTEGIMHIREGQHSSTVQTNEQQIVLIEDAESHAFSTNLLMDTSFKERATINGERVQLELVRTYRNAFQQAIPFKNGTPVISFIVAGAQYRGSVLMAQGDYKKLGNLTVAFDHPKPADIHFHLKNDSFIVSSTSTIFSFPSAQAEDAIISNEPIALESDILYKIKYYNLMVQQMLPSAKIEFIESSGHGHKSGKPGFSFEISNAQGASEKIMLWKENFDADTLYTDFMGQKIGLFYGRKTFEVPFQLELNRFKIDRYPGSNSPSSFSSYVTLFEEGKAPLPFHIYMNNILKYKGYRFFQSSYDNDEKGTILSVNHDAAGTYISYLGYFLLTLGIILSMLSKDSFFRKTLVTDKMLMVLLLILGGAFTVDAQQYLTDQQNVVDAIHAEAFGKLLIQNSKGRTEPIFTLTSELFRKISREEEILGMTPTQLFLEINMDPKLGINAPIIRVTNAKLKEQLRISGKFAAFSHFVVQDSVYMLQSLVNKTYAIPPSERSKYDKAVLKLDEKINICYSIFSGKLLTVFPVSDKDNESWKSPEEAFRFAGSKTDADFLTTAFSNYLIAVHKAKQDGDYTNANTLLEQMKEYQQQHATYTLPSSFKTNLEVYYYKWNVFKKLFPLYAMLGTIMIFILIAFIIMGKDLPKRGKRIFESIMLLAFLIQTAGISARWIISGHAPMSNGYESMIFIAWVTILAGFIFRKYSTFALPATAVLAALTLMVANLSFMDPQITNLVPVLQSYWLTIHVSVITGSYGFLALGMLLGIINLILITLRKTSNRQRFNETILNLTVINHKSLIIGLYLLTIGTFLGAVWANESWGRYWGWDPKETWALISIIVYTIVTHARYIPGLKGVYAFNALSLVAFSSVLMTYFGVNYYLSGMHSYAAGDTVAVPTFVYYAIAGVFLLILVSYINYLKMSPKKNT